MKKNHFWKILCISTSTLIVAILLIGTVLYRMGSNPKGSTVTPRYASSAENASRLSNQGDMKLSTSFSSELSGKAADYIGYDEVEYAEYEAENGGNGSSGGDDQTNPSGSTLIDTEKLIYRCNAQIDTLEFDAAINSFRTLVSSYNGFIQTENYSDGGSSNIYYNKNTVKKQNYSATVRIPSEHYDEFVNNMGDLGLIRSKTSNVENVSQEYSDLRTSLEIYQADYDYYLKLIGESKDESIMLMYHDKLTETKKEIERIKTRLNHIDNDVAYSYVTVSIREVFEMEDDPVYVQEPKTFGQRMAKTLRDSAEGFLTFLEDLLVVFIWLAPYLLLLVFIIFVSALIVRGMVRHHQKKANKYSERKPDPTEPSDGSKDKS